MLSINQIAEEYHQFVDCDMGLVNSLEASDPVDDRKLRHHRGTHPEKMIAVAKALPEHDFHSVVDHIELRADNGKRGDTAW